MVVRLRLEMPLDFGGELTAALYDKKSTDVRLLSDRGDRVDAHRCVLGICSPLLAALFQEEEFRYRDSVYISLPGYSREVMVTFIRFLYTGVARVRSGSSVSDEFLDLCRVLKIGAAVEKFPDEEGLELEPIESKARQEHNHRNRRSEDVSRYQKKSRRSRERSKELCTSKSNRSRNSSDGRTNHAPSVCRDEKLQRFYGAEGGKSFRCEENGVPESILLPEDAEPTPNSSGKAGFTKMIKEETDQLLLSNEVENSPFIDQRPKSEALVKLEFEENMDSMELEHESHRMNINQESAEEIERFMLNNIEEEIDPGAETEDPPDQDSEDERKAEALAAEIAVEEAKKANENLSNFSNDISRKKSEFQDGFQMPDNFDFPVEEFVKSNVFHAQNEAEKEHILESSPPSGYVFGKNSNIEYDSTEDEEYYASSVLDKKRRRALQILTKEESDPLKEPETSTSSTKSIGIKRTKQKKKNSRERRAIDDNGIEYEDDKRTREPSSSSEEESVMNDVEAQERSKKTSQKTRRASGTGKKSQKKRAGKKKLSQSDEERLEEEIFRVRYFDDLLDSQPRKTVKVTFVSDEPTRIFELRDVKLLPSVAKVLSGNLTKKRKRIKPLCDSSNSSSDEEPGGKKIVTSERTLSQISKFSKERGKSSSESSVSSENEDDRKKDKKRFTSGNEIIPKNEKKYSRSKSADLSSKFGVLHKKKADVINRQHSLSSSCPKPRPPPPFNSNSHSYGLSHENKLLAENRANRPEKIQEIMKKNFKKKPTEVKNEEPPSHLPINLPPDVSKTISIPPVLLSTSSPATQQPTLTQAFLMKNVEIDHIYQGPQQKLMPRPGGSVTPRPLPSPGLFSMTRPPPRMPHTVGFSRPPPFAFGPEHIRSRLPGPSPRMYRFP